LAGTQGGVTLEGKAPATGGYVKLAPIPAFPLVGVELTGSSGVSVIRFRLVFGSIRHQPRLILRSLAACDNPKRVERDPMQGC
jgi:hypothetical protein